MLSPLKNRSQQLVFSSKAMAGMSLTSAMAVGPVAQHQRQRLPAQQLHHLTPQQRQPTPAPLPRPVLLHHLTAIQTLHRPWVDVAADALATKSGLAFVFDSFNP